MSGAFSRFFKRTPTNTVPQTPTNTVPQTPPSDLNTIQGTSPMGSLFQGAPQAATSYVTTTQEMPKWLQDAIYNQIQTSTNIANRPYTPYEPKPIEGATYLGGNIIGLSPLEQQAYNLAQQNVGAYQPQMTAASTGIMDVAGKGTADQLRQAQSAYLPSGLADTNLQQGQQSWGGAAGLNVVGAAQPYLQQAGQTTAESLAERALTAADPYLRASSQTSASQVGQYMSPYQENVLDTIAKRGARNLQENILPNVSDAFIRAGQFGSSRMGEFGARAARDTQEAVLNAQAQAAQQGYGQSLQAAQADLARQAQLAGTVGSISGADLSRLLQGGAQYGNLGQTSGQMTSQQMQNLMNLGQMQAGAGQAQQQLGLTAAQQGQQAQAQDYARQISALQNLADVARQNQALRIGDVAALESAGQAGRNVQQAAADAMRGEYMAERLYPQQQLDWLSTQIRGMAPITPQPSTQSGVTSGATYAPSPLSQLATGLYTIQGLRNI